MSLRQIAVVVVEDMSVDIPVDMMPDLVAPSPRCCWEKDVRLIVMLL
jgi:hypothetical protein